MSLIPATTELDRDLADLTSDILAGAEALNHTASVLTSRHARFWSVPTARLLAALNADVSRTLSIFAANTATATALPTTMGRSDIAFDANSGQFVLIQS
ncbi:MAG: hypothetical protein MUF31_16710 [Akkermansiaceae bacterium]|nr:hypothetical protein [Akkermansiaceae bacterium]